MPIKVMIYEDNDSLRESLSALINGTYDFQLAGAHFNCGNIKQEADETNPDVMLMDIEMPGTNGIEGLKQLKQHRPEIEVLMLNVFDDDDHIFECLRNGASGYILKRTPPAKILEAIQEVHNGGSPMSAFIARKVVQHFNQKTNNLTQREKELLAFLVKGLSYKMIAAEMKVTIHTVQQHIKHIYTKLQVHNMGEAVAKAIQNNIV